MKNNINLKSITNSNNDFRNIGSYKVKRQSDVVKMNQESLVQIILKIPILSHRSSEISIIPSIWNLIPLIDMRCKFVAHLFSPKDIIGYENLMSLVEFNMFSSHRNFGTAGGTMDG